MIKKIDRDCEFLRTDLRRNGIQSSWDYQADLRFARYIQDEDAVKVMEHVIKSSAPFSIIIGVHNSAAGHIKDRRITALRELVKRGIAESEWTGLGLGARMEFGVNKIKNYWLSDQLDKA